MHTTRATPGLLTLLALTALTACGTDPGPGTGPGGGEGHDAGSGTVRTEPPVTGVRWVVESVTAAGGKTEALPGRAHFTLGEDGTVEGNLGCNSFHGRADVDGPTVTFGPFVSTRKLCPGPESELERALTGVLEGRTTYTVKGRALSLTAAGGEGPGLEATADPESPPPAPGTGTGTGTG
ncbi:META domain-containing protein [Streptomyces nitrosporeus]|uniref:META domain-containing protein n=1 Tax=Streptomyces nitrosporeus TaxID=28894 RepID=UPI0039A3273B